MHLLLVADDGQILEGIVLAAGFNTMRIAIRGRHDIVELQSTEGCWRTDGAQELEIASLTAESEAEAKFFGRAIRPQALAAGAVFAH